MILRLDNANILKFVFFKKYVDRPELRFRILFEYYNELHSPQSDDSVVNDKIEKIDVADFEKNAAQVWLIDSGFVRGKNEYVGGTSPIPFISGINARGINFVESVMDTAFTEIKDKFDDIGKLSKTERITKFSEECLHHPIDNKMCKVTLQAVVDFMTKSTR